jgi:hypothetical protein
MVLTLQLDTWFGVAAAPLALCRRRHQGATRLMARALSGCAAAALGHD